MATDYSKKTVADLQELLKSRSLPHSGKKAELVARLQSADSEQAEKPADDADEITDDFNIDDPATETKAAAPTPAPAAAAVNAAGGKGQPLNPPAVPNQAVDTDPSKTDDLKVKAPGAENGSTNGENAAAAPAVGFTSGLKESTLDEEAEKRRKRAERFGIVKTDEEKKTEERAKRFGTESESVVKGLDQALPERSRKRGRGDDAGPQEPRGDKRSRVRGGGGGDAGEKKPAGGSWMSEKDKAAADARKKRFA